jgi:hypothetical protein
VLYFRIDDLSSLTLIIALFRRVWGLPLWQYFLLLSAYLADWTIHDYSIK